MQKYALIVAGGSGKRMQSELPKQFIVIGNRPILMHTMQKFYAYSPDIQIIVVLPASEFAAWQALLEQYQFDIPHQLVAGGEQRTDSVRNGLQVIDNEASIVAIHDGVRPFVNIETIAESYLTAEEKGSAIATVASKDSLRQKTGDTTVAVDRSQYFLVQTPQTFQTALIKKAYQQPDIQALTDDASVAEKAGYAIHLIAGSYQNIKITTPEDLSVAEAFLKNAKF
ncbi:MAG: 2-C-methyl-D-erythritol 4-phosphate cytidylyltransferase [Microscillaceae bacterium]|jgi:2-C-methyl-D-erythritol 4-phosphate cytidylyltransferase|nr:2-C-methyl-D-erythritol 4-phosphate cytidylyltransferase [Microscillaceae bacterium]